MTEAARILATLSEPELRILAMLKLKRDCQCPRCKADRTGEFVPMACDVKRKRKGRAA